MSVSGRGRLGEFLHTRRARLRPADVGLRDYGDRRRVTGLRREELALLAGVSASYYTRLEQGQSVGASPEVLDALARALRLSAAERHHLHDLAEAARRHGAGRATRRPPAEYAGPATLALLDTLEQVPALVSGRRADVLAWNGLGHALFAGHLDATAPQRPAARPNLARLLFTDPHTRALYADWPAKARALVRTLRMVAGRYPDDPLLTSLVGELTVKSPEFSAMWKDHGVDRCELAGYEMRHPLIGSLTVTQQSLAIPQDEDQLLVLAVTEPGSPSHAALRLLPHCTASGGTSRPKAGGDASAPTR